MFLSDLGNCQITIAVNIKSINPIFKKISFKLPWVTALVIFDFLNFRLATVALLEDIFKLQLSKAISGLVFVANLVYSLRLVAYAPWSICI